MNTLQLLQPTPGTKYFLEKDQHLQPTETLYASSIATAIILKIVKPASTYHKQIIHPFTGNLSTA